MDGSLHSKIEKLSLSGTLVWPIVEGGKGIGVSNGLTAGAFAREDCVGTFSGAAPILYDDNGEIVHLEHVAKNRVERHEELISYGIKACIANARIAREVSQGKGRIHMNILWEMSASQRIIRETLDAAKDCIHGITCGAGMPYKVAEICASYGVHYYPIVSSVRAFRALWLRSYRKYSDFLGGVVYEDPWYAGGHNGLSNAEDPLKREAPYSRLVLLRSYMNEVGLSEVPIIYGGGVWTLSEYSEWLSDPRIGKIAFQLGTRPLLTKESPIPTEWKRLLTNLKDGDVILNQFSPTGFYSSAIRNEFLKELQSRIERQIEFSREKNDIFSMPLSRSSRGQEVYIKLEDHEKVVDWKDGGFDVPVATPDETFVFVTKKDANSIKLSQSKCKGCLSACRFSNWSDEPEKNYTTNILPDPRSFCIQDALRDAALGKKGIDEVLLFSGHRAYEFGNTKMYDNGNVPTIKELIDALLAGK